MVARPVDRDWTTFESALPAGWRDAAKTTGAIEDREGPLCDPVVRLRAILGCVSGDLPLRDAADHARCSGLADFSHVALHNAMKTSGDWLEWMVEAMLSDTISELPRSDLNIRLVDATCASKPGSDRTDFRLHVCLSLPERRFTHAELTDDKGGESFTRFEVKPGDLFVGDRGYGNPRGVNHVAQGGGDVLVRANNTSLPMYEPDGKSLSPLRLARQLRPGQSLDVDAEVRPKGAKPMVGRLCVYALSPEDAAKARKRVLRTKKYRNGKGRKVAGVAVQSANYIFVFTTLTRSKATSAQVFAIYRLRWQIELAFKTIKTVLKYARLPNHGPRSSRTWLLAKLLCALVADRLVAKSQAFPPERAAA